MKQWFGWLLGTIVAGTVLILALWAFQMGRKGPAREHEREEPIKTAHRGGGAGERVVAAQPQTLTEQYEAYGRVEPVAVVTVQALQNGVVTGLTALPGSAVQAGQKLGELSGPELAAHLGEAEAAVKSAKLKLSAAQKVLKLEQQQLASRLSTQQRVADAESAVADATGALAVAESRLSVARLATTIISPAAGTVLAVDAASGQRVGPGQSVLTLQTPGQIWLKATYYGRATAAIHPGMEGTFAPAAGGPTIPVKVATVFGALERDGGEGVGLFATSGAPGWLSGQFGTVTLSGEARSGVAVPTRALILDQGKWWVMVQTPQGEQPRQVVPGPARGWQTFIEHGLEAGARVVVGNAYLEFHRGISQSYQMPD